MLYFCLVGTAAALGAFLRRKMHADLDYRQLMQNQRMDVFPAAQVGGPLFL